MAEEYKMSPAEMREIAGRYGQEGVEIQDSIKRMDALMPLLEEAWRGPSTEAYKERYKELREGFIATQKLVEDIALKLKAIADKREADEYELARSIRR